MAEKYKFPSEMAADLRRNLLDQFTIMREK